MKNLKKEETFVELITQNQGIIHKVCNLYGKGQNKEDLFQEIVLQLWKALPSFNAHRNAKLTTWMYRVALNTAITSFRKKERQPTYTELSSKELQIPDFDISIDHEKEQLQNLYRAIRQLREIERAIIMLYLEGHNYQEMAEIIGMTENNIGVKLNRIKKKLKKTLIQLEKTT